MKNYWKMSDFSLFAVPYAYVDHSSYLADQLFLQNKITMKFKGEMVKDAFIKRYILLHFLILAFVPSSIIFAILPQASG